MEIDATKLTKIAETLNEICNNQYIIRVGRYTGDYHLGDGNFKQITGELFIKTDSDTLFRVVSDNSAIIDDFDVIGSDAIVTKIDKELENNPTDYINIDVANKSSLRSYFGKDETEVEKFEMVQSVPIRFREDAIDVVDKAEDERTLNKAWDMFLDTILAEFTEEELREYHFG